MNATEPMDKLTPGQLANNGMTVLSLQSALSRSDTNLNLVPKLIQRLAKEEAWQAFTLGDSPRVHKWKPAEFRRFIEADRPAGCQTPIYLLERCLKGSDAWTTFQELTRAEPGGANNPYGRAGKPEPEINCDNIPVDFAPPKPPHTGTSVSYTLRRLKKERPDLLERVKAGEVSAHAAAVEAGFREKQITIPADPRKAAQRLVRHFTREQFSAMVDEAIKLYTER